MFELAFENRTENVHTATILGSLIGSEYVRESSGKSANLNRSEDRYNTREEILAAMVAREGDQSSGVKMPSIHGQVQRASASSMPEQLVATWQQLAKSRLPIETFRIVIRLARMRSGWRGPGSRPLHARSLAAFLHFWRGIVEHAAPPDLTLTPAGNLLAQWFRDDRHYLDLEFTPDDRIYFGLFDGASASEGVDRPLAVQQMLSNRASGRCFRWSATGR